MISAIADFSVPLAVPLVLLVVLLVRLAAVQHPRYDAQRGAQQRLSRLSDGHRYSTTVVPAQFVLVEYAYMYRTQYSVLVLAAAGVVGILSVGLEPYAYL